MFLLARILDADEGCMGIELVLELEVSKYMLCGMFVFLYLMI